MRPKCAAAPRRCRDRPIERAEEERQEQVAVDPAPAEQAVVDARREEPFGAVEPSLGLDEVQEEHASELEQRQLVSDIVRGWRAAGRP